MPLFYLGFQRAPPETVSSEETIQISPTVVNDLRDEVYQPAEGEESPVISIAWLQQTSTNGWKLIEQIVQTIEWEGPHTAYKPISISVPTSDSLRGSSSLRLSLFTSRQKHQEAKTHEDMNGKEAKRRKVVHDAGNSDDWIFEIGTDLATKVESNVILVPVLSAPIRIEVTSLREGPATKSSSTTRLLRVGESAVVEICEESGYELDRHIWDASLLFSSYLTPRLRRIEGKRLVPCARDHESLRILELGAGTGILSILFSADMASCYQNEEQQDVQVIATDLDSALPLLQKNIDLNRHHWKACCLEVECRALDWMEKDPIDDLDLIFVSDCTYNPTYFRALCSSVHRLLASGTKEALCLLAKKHRHDDEETLWEEVEKSGLQSKLLLGHQTVGEGGLWGLWELQCAPNV